MRLRTFYIIVIVLLFVYIVAESQARVPTVQQAKTYLLDTNKPRRSEAVNHCIRLDTFVECTLVLTYHGYYEFHGEGKTTKERIELVVPSQQAVAWKGRYLVSWELPEETEAWGRWQ